jgi:hypothetical protein
MKIAPRTRDKLHDLALLHEKYARWLREHELQDANCLCSISQPTRCAGALQLQNFQNFQNCEGLWLDGFAEMTPQELDLLAAILAVLRKRHARVLPRRIRLP